MALVGMDTLFVGERFARLVEDRLRDLMSPAPELVFIASHTHFAPSLDGSKPGLGTVCSRYYLETVSRVAGAVQTAASRAPIPARLFHGQVDCRGGVYRRLRTPMPSLRPPFIRSGIAMAPNPSRAIDRTLHAFVGTGPEGKQSFVLWTWPCHPVSHNRPQEVSPDFPGVVRDAFRTFFHSPRLPVIFFPGFSGDIRPHFVEGLPTPRRALRHPFARGFGVPSDARLTNFHSEVSRAAVKAAETSSEVDLDEGLDYTLVTVPLSDLLTNSASGAMPVYRLSTGEFEMVLFGAEVCSGYRQLVAPHLSTDFIMSGCCGTTFGYLPTDAQIQHGGYESAGSLPLFGHAGRYRTHVEETVLHEAFGA